MIRNANRSGAGELDVLVADDDPIFRELACKALASLGYASRPASDGSEALKVMAGPPISLAIVDLQMPNVDGFALIRCLRASPRSRHVPIVVVTSRSDHQAIGEAFEAGATLFLTKPVHWPTFADHVRYLMRMAAATSQQRSRMQCAEAASRLKDAAIAQAVASSLELTQKIRQLTRRIRIHSEARGELHFLEDDLVMIGKEVDRLETALVDAQQLACRLSQRMTAQPRLIALDDIISEALQAAAPSAEAHGIQINSSGARSDVRVACYDEAIADALALILCNAARVSPPQGKVRVDTAVHEDGLLTISVSDDGPGMDPDFFASCLSPLDDSGELPPDPTGTQCEGISFAKAVAEAHGGALEIRSMPMQGTTVMLALPAERVFTARGATA